MSQIGKLCAVLLVGCLAVVGCKKEESGSAGAGGGASTQSSSTGGKKVKIGIVAKSISNAVFQAAHSGAQDAAKELGPKYGVDVEVEIRTPTDEDPQKQAEAVEALMRAGVDGIAISCSEANTVTPAIDRAVGRGIQVVCFDSDAANSKRFAYYGTDDTTCGQRVMAELAKAMGDKGTIAILAGNQSAPNLQARVAAVREELKKHPNMKELNNGQGVFYHQETPEKAAEAVANAQNANPGIEGWAMVGGWPLFTTNALKWEPGKVKVVAVDALPAQLPYLKSGHVQLLLAQDCYGWGHKSVDLLLAKIVNKQDPPSQKVIDPLTAVTKETADEYGKNWEKWLGGK
ncbi:MAG: ribose transport system substrate-binding protein [Humisphaera sp.]|nr:ribose transport system substrate-binding protein [Humisphaera sp.]